jgi:hypothetical protein
MLALSLERRCTEALGCGGCFKLKSFNFFELHGGLKIMNFNRVKTVFGLKYGVC